MKHSLAAVVAVALWTALIALTQAHAGLLNLFVYGMPDRYGQAFTQRTAGTVTAAQELARKANPAPAPGAAEVTAFFERARAPQAAPILWRPLQHDRLVHSCSVY